MAQATRRAATRSGTRSRSSRRRAGRGAMGAVRGALDDDFDTPAALAVLHDWAGAGQLELLARGLDVFGLESLAERDEAPRRGGGARRAPGDARAPRETSTTSDRLRDELARARLADARRAGRRLHARSAVTPDLVYGRRPVREALRGRREVLELWATERALKAEPWLADARGRSCKADRELSERAGTRDHQGVLALVEPFRYADAYELAAAERPLLAVLDRVTDPRNLGAVCRSAEGAGATGVVVPAHGSARRDAGGRARVGRRGRASAGRGRDEPRALPRRGQGRRPLGLRRGRRVRGDADVGRRPLGRRRDRARRRGEGPAPARPPHLRRRSSRSRSRARSSRSTSASPRRCCSTRRGASAVAEPDASISSTATTCCTPAAFDDAARAARRARELRRAPRRARHRRLRRRRRRRAAAARSRCATRRTRTRCSSGSPPSTGRGRRVVPRHERRDVAGGLGHRGGEASPRQRSAAELAPAERGEERAAAASRGEARRGDASPRSSGCAEASKSGPPQMGLVLFAGPC